MVEAAQDRAGRRWHGAARRRYYSPSPKEPSRVSSDKVNPSAHGWGIAALIIALAIIANVTAYSIHQATYLKPDVKATAK
jgi:hypothetical protein